MTSFVQLFRGRRRLATMRAIQTVGLCGAAAALVAMRHPRSEPTFAQDVAPVLYKNSAVCHHDGGIAPFSVLEYDDVAQRADNIRERVASGEMPPWHAAAPRGTFTNDPRLTDA